MQHCRFWTLDDGMDDQQRQTPEPDPRHHRAAPALIVAALTVVLSVALRTYTDLSSGYQIAIVAAACAGGILLTRRSWSAQLGLDDPQSRSGRLAIVIALVAIALVLAVLAGGWVDAPDTGSG